MFLLGTRNTTSQTVVTNETLNLGEVYRKFCRKNQCGIKPFEFSSNSIALQHSGFYHATATITFSAPTAGNVVLQLTENGTAISGAIATETITTATTEVKTTTIDFYVLVDNGCVLGNPTTLIKNLAILNSGVTATITNVVLNVEKVV